MIERLRPSSAVNLLGVNSAVLRLALAACAGLTLACDGPTGGSTPYELASWELERELAVGSREGDDALSRPVSLAVSADGLLAVTQRGVPRVHVYDDTGELAWTAGTRGEGPGEFQRPGAVGWRGDTLWVRDGGLARLSLFTDSGTFVETLRPGGEGASTSSSRARRRPLTPVGLFADGSLHSRKTGRISVGMVAPTHELRVDRETGAVDTLARLEYPDQNGRPLELGGRRLVGIQLGPDVFGSTPSVGALPSGRGLVAVERPPATGEGEATFPVTHIDLAGDTVWRRQIRYRPRRLSAVSADSILRAWIGEQPRLRSMASPERLLQAFRDQIDPPASWPPVSEMALGTDGSIWLRREADGRDPMPWLVLDAEGRPVARVEAPVELGSPVSVTEEHLWGRVADELDVSYLVRYRIRRRVR